MNHTADIVVILDQSGSMYQLKTDAIGGFNSLLEEQKKVPGQATMTLVTFSIARNFVLKRVPLQQAQPLTEETYRPGGSTALLDAIGHVMTEVRQWDAPDNPDHKKICTIITDGHENASHEWSNEGVKKLTAELTADGWEFIFLGANQDAFDSARRMGVDSARTSNYEATSIGTRSAFGVAGQSITDLRGQPRPPQP